MNIPENTAENREKLREILEQLKRTVDDACLGGQAYYTSIRDFVRYYIGLPYYKACNKLLHAATRLWPKHSGSAMHPVPPPEGVTSPYYAHYALPPWSGEYGRKSMELLEFLITWCKETTND